MTEEATPAPEAATNPAAAPQPGLKIITQYIRDMSFENVYASKGMTGDVKPEIEVSVALDARKRAEPDQFEVIQKYKITSKSKDTGDTIFLLELEYGGLFELKNVPEDQLHPFALIECPRMVFPYVRRIVGDITRDGGFPPLNLDSVDFVALYRNEIQRRAKAQSANTAPV